MMVEPPIGNLMKRMDSRYSLVIAASKRARQIAAQAKDRGVIITEKPVKTAINEIAAGEVSIVESKEQY